MLLHSGKHNKEISNLANGNRLEFDAPKYEQRDCVVFITSNVKPTRYW